MVKNILALLGISVVGVACFAYGAISAAVAFGKDDCCSRDTLLGECANNLAEALYDAESKPKGELS